MLCELLVPEIMAATCQRQARRDFWAGQATGYLMKAGGDATPVYGLTGQLYLSSSGWLLMAVPNGLVRGLFSALDVPGAELPLKDGQLNAHCSVMSEDEVTKIGADNITERGKRFSYQLGPIHEVKPAAWKGISKVWFVQIVSPELKALRKSYGLTPLPHNNEFDFHVTVALRKVGVLGSNETRKADDD